MGVYYSKGKGWRYDFTHKKRRHTSGWYPRKSLATKAEAIKRQAIENASSQTQDLPLYELFHRRLEHLELYTSQGHYRDNHRTFKKVARKWGKLLCSTLTPDLIEQLHHQTARRVSSNTANRELVYLRACFRWGIKKRFLTNDPTTGVEFFPTEKTLKYIPPQSDIDKIISIADQEMADYVSTIRETLARVSEINQLKWTDIDLKERYVVLWTRKRKGSIKTPRHVPMTKTLLKILTRRYKERDRQVRYVFWHRYYSRKEGRWVTGPYNDRRRTLEQLILKAGVKRFTFHSIRHSSASTVEHAGATIGSLQRILGHRNRSTTELYIHAISESERQAMQKFEEMRQKSHINPHIKKENHLEQEP